MPRVAGLGRSIPYETTTFRVSVGSSFGSYTYDPSLELQYADATACGELGRAVFFRRYGPAVKLPHETAFKAVTPIDLVDKWVQVSAAWSGASTPIWTGVVKDETRVVKGHDGGPHGEQIWTAYEPMILLTRTRFGHSYWDRSSAVQRLDWTPSFNVRDSAGRLVGNRSTSALGETYVFGGEELWTRGQALLYLLSRFADYSSFGGPSWAVGGDPTLLDQATDVVELGESQTVGEVLRRLISPRLGIDYVIRAGSARLTLEVFSLQAREFSAGGVTLPRNTRRYTVTAGDPDVQATIVRSRAQRFGRIRVKGGRVVVCCSLRADDSTLTSKWTSAQETAYKAGTGTSADEAKLHDQARRRDYLRAVYQAFGAESAWDFNSGSAAPNVVADGSVSGGNAEFQNVVRRTLGWTPLREGVSYQGGLEVDGNPSGHTPEYRPPAAWVYDPVTARYVAVESVGVGVSPNANDWGVFLHGNPAHKLALADWSGAEATDGQPQYDWRTLVATIALETDQRLEVELVTGDDDGTVMEINAPNAELWYLAPLTIVGTTAKGELEDSGAKGRALRDDRAKLQWLAAAALARYGAERVRAEVKLKGGPRPLTGMLGAMLKSVQEGSDMNEVLAPITGVSYRPGLTEIRAGYPR